MTSLFFTFKTVSVLGGQDESDAVGVGERLRVGEKGGDGLDVRSITGNTTFICPLPFSIPISPFVLKDTGKSFKSSCHSCSIKVRKWKYNRKCLKLVTEQLPRRVTTVDEYGTNGTSKIYDAEEIRCSFSLECKISYNLQIKQYI